MSDENNDGIVMPKTVSDKPITEEVKQPEIIADSSPASEENHEEKTNGVQQRINDLTAKRYKEKRRAEEAEAKLAEYESKQAAPSFEPPEQIEAPALPEDLYDDEAMRKYHADTIAYNKQVAESAAKNQFESQQQERAKQDLNAKHQTTVDAYTANAQRDGVDFDKLLVAEQSLKQAGLTNELGSYLLNDANGAKIVEYLHDNPAEMHEIMKLDVVSAGIRIANEVKPKVLSQTPRVSGAPDPIPEVSGGGYAEVDEFSKKYPGAEII